MRRVIDIELTSWTIRNIGVRRREELGREDYEGGHDVPRVPLLSGGRTGFSCCFGAVRCIPAARSLGVKVEGDGT